MKAAPKARSERPGTPDTPGAPQVIALRDLTITWRRRSRFFGEPEDGVEMTITGAQLAAVLGTLAEEAPGGRWDELGDPTYLADRLESMNEVLHGLGASANFDGIEAMDMVARFVRSITAPLRGYREREAILEHATVTLGTRAA